MINVVFLAGVRQTFEHQLKPLKEDMVQLKGQVNEIDNVAKQAMQVASAAQAATQEIRSEIQAGKCNDTINQRIADIESKLAQQPRNKGQHSDTAFFSGFEDVTKQVAEDWLTRKFKELNVHAPLKMYTKGNEFKGKVFAEFASSDEVQKIARMFADEKPTLSGKEISGKEDLPVETRAPLGFLLSLRWQLNQWGFTKKEIKVNDEEFIMKVGGVPVVQASVRENKLCLLWKDSSWENWPELQNSEELRSLIAVANNKMSKSEEGKAKGKGKGPSGPQ